MAPDKRLGNTDETGAVVEWPEVTISGLPLPNPPYSRIHIAPGWFAVHDVYGAPDAGLIIELRELVQPRQTSKRRYTAPEDDNE